MQGPESKKILMTLSGGRQLTPENVKNALNSLTMEGKPVRIAKTGYTGEPIGYELYCNSEDARYFWDRLIELGAKPTALGARDTTRMEAALPLYGHEMGECEMGGEIQNLRRAAGKVRRFLRRSQRRFHRPRTAAGSSLRRSRRS